VLDQESGNFGIWSNVIWLIGKQEYFFPGLAKGHLAKGQLAKYQFAKCQLAKCQLAYCWSLKCQ
jgi:hypothetical protein